MPTEWDTMYATDDFRYGTAPNTWIVAAVKKFKVVAQIKNQRGPAGSPGVRSHEVIELAAGEGRNSVWLARQGLTVLACDSSAVGLEKAAGLARTQGVALDIRRTDVLQSSPTSPALLVLSTFFHTPPAQTAQMLNTHANLVAPEGWLVAEWFHPEQRWGHYRSGGPPDPDMMITPEYLHDFFRMVSDRDSSTWQLFVCARVERDLREGTKHNGPAIVTRLAAQRGRGPVGTESAGP